MSKNTSSETPLGSLATQWRETRPRDRGQVLSHFVDRLLVVAHASDEYATLKEIGDGFPDFVLEGTSQQQVACKLALRLPRRIPERLRDLVVLKWIEALIEVLRLGAPTTRDAAVEGLGALLALVDDPPGSFPQDKSLPVVREPGETDDAYSQRVRISDEYFARLGRRRLMVLTIAGEPQAADQFRELLEEPIHDKLAYLLGREAVPWALIEHVLNEHADLLRILPALARQGRDLRLDTAELLRAAARILRIADDAPPTLLVALARFQESIFRTIDAAMRRPQHWKWKDFDEVVAAAIRALPQSIGGPPAVCNGQIRATIAMLRTGVRLILASGGSSQTKKAIQPLFENTDGRMRWSNLGLVEGCYRALPDLVTDARHNGLTDQALETLFQQLQRSHQTDDPVEIHRHLIANATFRRMLILVAAREHETVSSEETKVGRQLRLLLRQPTPENIRRICQRDEDVKASPPGMLPADAAHLVIAGIAFESELLERSTSLLQKWETFSTVRRVLFTRILAAQLHAISRDAPELWRHPVLKRLFSGIPTISMTDAEAMRVVLALLSSLPPGAAESADAEVQRFVEYRGWSEGDLPGYVLAMISPTASGRIAGAIAREIDLNLRRERRGGKPADLAKSLHQVMLRGPDEAIFDHLLPRVAGELDRKLVSLFRRHVGGVLHAAKPGERFDLEDIRRHLKSLMPDLRGQESPTLQKLQGALELFLELTAGTPYIWKHSPEKLFRLLDELAAAETHRAHLLPAFASKLTELREEMARYVGIPVGRFTRRRDALSKAAGVARQIESLLNHHKGLQPPERSLLVTLIQRYRDLFEQSAALYCEEARRFREANDAKRFWAYLCDTRKRRTRILEAQKLEESQQHERVAERIEREPPPFPRQRAKFEEYLVEWRASELDVDSLRNVLKKRWPRWFRGVYWIITNFWVMSLVILAPCATAILADWFSFHSWEGAGFFVLTLGIIVAGWLSFTQIIHVLARWLWKRKHEKPGYWFQCLLPRLARLIAVPMALIVEFDHSYEFPLHASTWALLLLMVISFLTTRFFVAREIVDRKEHPGTIQITRPERRRVRQIVAVALAHSFVIALVLSAIFAAGYRDHESSHHEARAVEPSFEKTSSWYQVVRGLKYLDSVSKRHPRQRFLGVLPREVTFDLGAIARLNGCPMPTKIGELAAFRFYPTIILSWTALGLFFGVFLEGFMKGERLRGAAPREDRDEPRL